MTAFFSPHSAKRSQMVERIGSKEKSPHSEDLREITFEEFAELVRQMRHNQRRYKAQRKEAILETCEAYEKQVDDILARMFDTQLRLF